MAQEYIQPELGIKIPGEERKEPFPLSTVVPRGIAQVKKALPQDIDRMLQDEFGSLELSRYYKKIRRKPVPTAIQGAFSLDEPAAAIPSIRLSGPWDASSEHLLAGLQQYQFLALRRPNGVLLPDKSNAIKIDFHPSIDDFTAHDYWPTLNYGKPAAITCAVRTPTITWSHAYIFPRQNQAFVELLRNNDEVLELLLRRDNHIAPLSQIMQEFGYTIRRSHSGFLPRGLLWKENQNLSRPFSIEGIDSLIVQGRQEFLMDQRTHTIISRLRADKPAHLALRFRRYSSEQRRSKEGSYHFRPDLSIQKLVSINASYAALQEVFQHPDRTRPYAAVVVDSDCPTKNAFTNYPFADQIHGVVTRYAFENNPGANVKEIMSPARIVRKSEVLKNNFDKISQQFYRSGVAALLIDNDVPTSVPGYYSVEEREFALAQARREDGRVTQMATLGSFIGGSMEPRLSEKQVIIGGYDLDTLTALQKAFMWRNTEDVLAITNVVSIGKKKYFLPMLDFASGPYETIRERMQSLREPGFIVGSGNSFHFYGDRLLEQSQFQKFYEDAFYKMMDLVDPSYIACSLRRNFACLRVTANSTTKPHMPTYLGEV